MHVTRRMARNLAWADSKNPFGKLHNRKTSDALSNAERGKERGLYRPNTDDPSHYPPTTEQDGSVWLNNDAGPHGSTSPAVVSRRRNNEPGDHIGDIRTDISPSASVDHLPPKEAQPGEKDIQMINGNRDSESQDEPKSVKPGGIRGFFQGKLKDRKDTMEDDNGKPKNKKHFTVMGQLKATLFNSWINILLIASPVGFALNYAHANDYAIFVVNFIAIIPLAAMLSYATEEIALRTGETIGGLLNASFGNAVELIVSIIALAKNQILIVQTSLIGSMLSNLLLVLGMCFFAGGINRMEQAFNMTVAQTAASLLFLAVSSLLIPTAFDEWANTGNTDKTTSGAPLVNGVLPLSRATAILLLIVYACYLFFQLKSHAKMYNAPSEKNSKRDFSKQKSRMKSIVPDKMRRRSVETAASPVSEQNEENDEEMGGEEPQLSLTVAIITLIASTVLVAFNAEFLVDSIDLITCGGSGIQKNFVGLILLPIVGNAAEHATSVTVAIKDKMDLAIGVAVGSSMQIALLVLPLVVILGWIIGKDDMTLYFDGFQIAVLFVAVLLVNYLIQDGKSHWLEGVLLMTLYIIVAVAAWYYPTDPRLNNCPNTS